MAIWLNGGLGVFHVKPESCRIFVQINFRDGEKYLPAWRNWQTRWTQNPVAVRPCGFEPLRRQLYSVISLDWTI
jgi:hypothetical protein